jgi:hypothetical protein
MEAGRVMVRKVEVAKVVAEAAAVVRARETVVDVMAAALAMDVLAE